MQRRNRVMVATAAALLAAALAGPAWAQRVQMGTIRLSSTPRGATVYVDGATEPAGRTPAAVRVPRGEHRLLLRLDGYAPAERTVDLARGSARLSVELVALVTLEVAAADDSAAGAAVLVDGESAGALPIRHGVTPGRHQIDVQREGYEPFRRWVEMAAGRDQSISVVLQPAAPPTGAVMVIGNVPGAPVFVDGEAVGASPVVLDLPPGPHVVEIRPEGQPRHTEVAVVEEGRRITVNPTIQPPPPETGALVVVTDPPGARVSVDGAVRGVSPLTLADLSPGAHIVEARAAGRRDASARAEVAAGRQESIRLALEEEAVTGSVRVTSTVEGSEVLVDGQRVGTAPVEHEGLSRGEHDVVVRAPGRREWRHHFLVRGAEMVTVAATPGGVERLTVESATPGAVVFVDGREVGPTPLRDDELEAGEHAVEIRAEGHISYTRTVTVTAGLAASVSAELPAVAPAEAPAEAPQLETPDARPPGWSRRGSLFAHSAIPMKPYRLTIGGSWGWPFLLGTYRIGLGVFDNMDIAVEARSSYFFTELDAHLRYGFRLADIVGLGGEVSVGGGFGERGRNTALLGIVLWEGLELGPVAVALRQRLQVFWDLYDTAEDRHVSARVFVGLSVEWRILGPLYVFMVADYAPYAPVQADRRVLCGGAWDEDDGCSSWMSDFNLDARLGVGATFF